MKNNFNMCAEMENCEISIFFDSMVSQMDFNDNFKVIEHSSYSDCSSYLFFLSGGITEAPDSVASCYDLSHCTEKDFRAYCREASPETMTFRELVAEKNDNYSWRGDSWMELAIEFMNVDGLPDAMRNGFPEITGAIGLYECVSITGYSQGDCSNVLYKAERDSFLEDSDKARSVFTNYVYDSPIYARATVDDEEIYLDEAFSDSYSYEKSELIEYIDKLELSDSAKDWLKENLPDYPDYI